ncbi:MAG: hypothetical protein FWD65_04015 [Coriobacteriia bacterium]|nr:hypothetical protein [Coriobacteriia bacterium]
MTVVAILLVMTVIASFLTGFLSFSDMSLEEVAGMWHGYAMAVIAELLVLMTSSALFRSAWFNSSNPMRFYNITIMGNQRAMATGTFRLRMATYARAEVSRTVHLFPIRTMGNAK